MTMAKRLGAECLGTFWLVFGGCGSAVLAAAVPELGIGFLGVSFAFGLTVLTMAAGWAIAVNWLDGRDRHQMIKFVPLVWISMILSPTASLRRDRFSMAISHCRSKTDLM